MKTIYQTTANATAGRNGIAKTEDGLLEVNLSYPKEMGGAGNATNPEQLFAAGYAACFSNAILHVAREQKIAISAAPVSATIGIGANQSGGFSLSAALAIELELEQTAAVELVRIAHQVCPYSNAIRNNIEVELTVNKQLLA